MSAGFSTLHLWLLFFTSKVLFWVQWHISCLNALFSNSVVNGLSPWASCLLFLIFTHIHTCLFLFSFLLFKLIHSCTCFGLVVLSSSLLKLFFLIIKFTKSCTCFLLLRFFNIIVLFQSTLSLLESLRLLQLCWCSSFLILCRTSQLFILSLFCTSFLWCLSFLTTPLFHLRNLLFLLSICSKTSLLRHGFLLRNQLSPSSNSEFFLSLSFLLSTTFLFLFGSNLDSSSRLLINFKSTNWLLLRKLLLLWFLRLLFILPLVAHAFCDWFLLNINSADYTSSEPDNFDKLH